MAFLVTGSPIMVQLHCNGPTGKVSRISAAFSIFMGVPANSMAHSSRSMVDLALDQEGIKLGMLQLLIYSGAIKPVARPTPQRRVWSETYGESPGHLRTLRLCVRKGHAR